MLTLIHGENLIKSREKLWQMKAVAQKNGQKIDTLDAKKIKAASLELALTSNDLFGQNQLLVIEGLHSLPHSKKRTGYFSQLNSASQDLDIILWEKKLLTAANLKKFPQAVEFKYKMGKALWKLIDELGPQQKKQQLHTLSQAIKEDSPEFCFAMISKRVRELLAFNVGATEGIHPFVKSKLAHQVKGFSGAQLLELHQTLYELDAQLKQSKNLMSLAAQLDLFILNL